MRVQFYCPRWGSEKINWVTFFEKLVAAGYDGVEYAIGCNTSDAEMNTVWTLAEKHSVKIIIQHYDTYAAVFSKHFDEYCAWLEKIKPYPCEKVNSQTGKDFFSFDQNSALIYEGLRFSSATGIIVVHETHRNKFSFASHITKEYLEKIPKLKITLDASHWVCVAEPYMINDPRSGKPVSDQWGVNVYMMELLKKRYNHQNV